MLSRIFAAGMNVGADVTVRQEGGVTLTNAEGGQVQLANYARYSRGSALVCAYPKRVRPFS